MSHDELKLLFKLFPHKWRTTVRERSIVGRRGRARVEIYTTGLLSYLTDVNREDITESASRAYRSVWDFVGRLRTLRDPLDYDWLEGYVLKGAQSRIVLQADHLPESRGRSSASWFADFRASKISR